MQKSHPIPLVISAALLSMIQLVFWAGMDSAFSAPSSTAPKAKQFLLPPKQGAGATASQLHGKAVYHYYCAVCHGATGNSDGFNSYSLPQPPPKLSDPKFMQTLTDQTLKHVITDGGTAIGLSAHMPPWGGVLNDRDIEDTIQYIRTLTLR